MSSDEVINEAHINDLISLCYIFDEYEEFNKSIIDLFNSKLNYKETLNDLKKLTNGELCLPTKKVKLFYLENKNVIDTINKYSNIFNFMFNKYDDSNYLEYFYKYISKNKDKLDKILSLLERIKKLGFNKIKFNENLDFSIEEYNIYILIDGNEEIVYLDNINIIPNYDNNVVKYKTNDSNYKIILKKELDFSNYESEIIVNSLIFDFERLPKNIYPNQIFEEILKDKKYQKEQCNIVKNSIDLSVSISDLNSQLETTNKTIDSLDSIENKEEFLSILFIIKQNIEKLEIMSTMFDNSIIKNNSLITNESLQKEKKTYLKKRQWTGVDSD